MGIKEGLAGNAAKSLVSHFQSKWLLNTYRDTSVIELVKPNVRQLVMQFHPFSAEYMLAFACNFFSLLVYLWIILSSFVSSPPQRASLLSVALRPTSQWLVNQSLFVQSAQDTRGKASFTLSLSMAKRSTLVMKQNSSTLKASKHQSNSYCLLPIRILKALFLISKCFEKQCHSQFSIGSVFLSHFTMNINNHWCGVDLNELSCMLEVVLKVCCGPPFVCWYVCAYYCVLTSIFSQPPGVHVGH